MNRLLSDEIQKILVKNGFCVLFAKKATTGDVGISQGQIAARVRRLSRQIERDFSGRDLVVVAITKLLGGAGHAGSVTAGRFLLYAALTAAVAVLFSLVATRYRYRHPSFQKLVS